jgi:site-specific DNA recombinase
VTAQNESGGKKKAAAMKKKMGEADSRITELNRIIKRLYEDNVLGKTSDKRFALLSEEYEAE